MKLRDGERYQTWEHVWSAICGSFHRSLERIRFDWQAAGHPDLIDPFQCHHLFYYCTRQCIYCGGYLNIDDRSAEQLIEYTFCDHSYVTRGQWIHTQRCLRHAAILAGRHFYYIYTDADILSNADCRFRDPTA